MAKVKKKLPKERKVVSSKNTLKMLLGKYGDGIVWAFDGKQKEPEVEVIPTNCQSFNWVTGRGGVPRGRVTEVSGPESSGKTTLCYCIMATVQRAGGRAALIDAENAVDLDYMRLCGVDEKNNFIIAQPDYGEQALSMVEDIILDGRIDVVVVDSVAALIPKAELEAEMTDMQVGLQARMMAKSMRRITSLLKGSKTAVIFTNQLRDKIGGFGGFGPQTSTPGGRALKHAASVRIETRRTTPIKAGSAQIGFMTRVKVTKNKIAPPFREAQIPVVFNKGIDERLDFIELAIKSRALKKRASIFYYGEKAVGNGWLETYEKIIAREKLLEAVQSKIDKMFTKWSDAGRIEDPEADGGEDKNAKEDKD